MTIIATDIFPLPAPVNVARQVPVCDSPLTLKVAIGALTDDDVSVATSEGQVLFSKIVPEKSSCVTVTDATFVAHLLDPEFGQIAILDGLTDIGPGVTLVEGPPAPLGDAPALPVPPPQAERHATASAATAHRSGSWLRATRSRLDHTLKALR